jgi:hypothetical protein
MDSFSDYHTKHRHRGTGFTDTDSSYSRKRVNLVPDYMKKDLSKNQKIERLKDNGGMAVCTPIDLKYINDTFNIVPHKDRTQTLGKTGIQLSFDPITRNFILQK